MSSISSYKFARRPSKPASNSLQMFLFVLLFSTVIEASVQSNCATFQPTISYYPVSGDTSDQLKTTLGKAAQGFDAYASYNLARTPKCSNGVYTIEMTGSIEMPSKLTSSTSKNPTLITNYNIFNDNLLNHEFGHIANGRKLCEFFSQELSKDSGCGFSAAKIDGIVASGWSNIQEADRDYDATTGHGETQGACFSAFCKDTCVGCKERFLAGNSNATSSTTSSVLVTSTLSVTSSGSSTTGTATLSSSATSTTTTSGPGYSSTSTSTPTSIVNSATSTSELRAIAIFLVMAFSL